MSAAEGVADEAGVAGEGFRGGDAALFELGVDGGFHRFRVRERGVGDVEEIASKLAPTQILRGGDEFGPGGVVGGAAGEILHDAFEEPETDDVGEGAVATVADAFVGNAGGEGVGAEDGRVAFEADERPGAGAEEEVGAVGGRGHGVVGAGGVVAGDGDDLGGREGGEFGEGADFAEFGAGEDGFGEPVGRDAEVVESGARPVRGVDVEELGGAGDGQLVGHLARQEEIEVVGEEEAAGGEVGDRGVSCDGFFELEGGVVEDVGDAGGGVDAFEGGAGVGEALESGLGAVVAVCMNRIHEAAGVVDEGVVNAPGVHADGGEFGAFGEGGDGGAESGEDLGPEAGDVPIVVVAEGLEGVGKAVDFAKGEA